MARYQVEVDITWEPTRKTLTVYAPDDSAAEIKAEDIVLDWNNVRDVEVIYVEEDE